MGLKARKARPSDPALLAPRLRVADLQEIQATHGDMPPEHVIRESYELSEPCFTIVTDEGEVAGMFGVAPGDAKGTFGIIWLLGSDLLKKNSVSFLRQSHAWVEKLHKKYPVLTNLADRRNKLHLGWLKWIGCQFVGERPWGYEQRPFVEFIHV
jgi:hypothetical protein